MNWGILGFGYMGKKFFSESKALPNINVVAIASQSQKLIFDDKVERFSNYEDLILKSNLDGIYISTTPPKHFDIIKIAISNKVPIFCEKPIFFSEHETIEIKELAQSSYLSENISFMFNPKITDLISQIKNGLLGDLTEVRITLLRKLNPSARYRIMNHQTSRGALHDYGMYGIYFLKVLFEELSIINYDLRYEGLNDYEGNVNFLGNNTVKCKLFYSIQLEKGCDVFIEGQNGSVRFKDFLSPYTEVFVETYPASMAIYKNNKKNFKNDFSGVILLVSQEIISAKLESSYAPISTSIETAKLMFKIINNKL